jgi:hypothetical protein
MTQRRYYADLNPHWPSKGQRKYCVFRKDDDEAPTYKLDRLQFSQLRPAEREAYRLTVLHERARNRSIYLGD